MPVVNIGDDSKEKSSQYSLRGLTEVINRDLEVTIFSVSIDAEWSPGEYEISVWLGSSEQAQVKLRELTKLSFDFDPEDQPDDFLAAATELFEIDLSLFVDVLRNHRMVSMRASQQAFAPSPFAAPLVPVLKKLVQECAVEGVPGNKHRTTAVL